MYRLLSMDFFLRYVRKHPGKYGYLHKDLRSARMDIHYSSYVRNSVLYGIGAGILTLLYLYLIPLISQLSFLNIMHLFENFPFSFLIYLILPFLAGYTVYNLSLLYPRFIANSRKTKIDIVLPHAASFCFGMSKGGTQVLDVFKEIASNPNIYGEISKETLYIVRDVELLGKDLVTAMRNVAHTTPSEMFREFIENLVPMVEGGSNVHQYFSIKMDQYFANAKKSQELFIKTLELICEVYIVAFVAVPIFLLVTLVSIGMMNSSQAPYIFQAIYIGLPAGSIALIFIIDTISPKEDLGMNYEEKEIEKKAGFIWEEDLDEKEYSKLINEFNRRKSIRRLIGVLKNPFVPIYKEPLRAFYFSIPLMLLPFLFLDTGFDKQILLSLVVLMLPPSIAYEYKMRKLAKLDRSIPDFLRRLGEINEVGLTLQSAISLLLKSDIGVLSGEVKRVWLGLEWGNEMKDALARFENRVGTPSLRRAVTLLVKASEVSDDTKDVLMIAAEDADNMVSLRKQRFETGFVYMSTVYIAFFTFIYVCYSFSMEFLPSMSKLGTGSLVNVSQINSTMFSTCSILGFFSGIMTGQMAEGKVMFGLKHAILFLLLTYFSFTMFMEY